MRRTTSGVRLIEHNGETLGVCLGYDYCAEHEWGIKPLQASFGISATRKDSFGEKRAYGPAARQVTVTPDGLELITLGDKSVVLCFVGRDYTNSTVRSYIEGDLDRNLAFSSYSPEKTMVTAWGRSDFAIRAKGEKEIAVLHSLHEAILAKNALIYLLGSNNPFAGSGLCIVDLDKLPEDIAKAMYDADEDSHKLTIASEATGIKEKLSAAGKGYHALSPSWAGKIKSTVRGEIKTEYPVIYWLNPHHQNLYNSMWCTVEWLELWIAGTGPIVK